MSAMLFPMAIFPKALKERPVNGNGCKRFIPKVQVFSKCYNFFTYTSKNKNF